jgi:Dolichyl-phosphate-mannose-protein mannosyltransferase
VFRTSITRAEYNGEKENRAVLAQPHRYAKILAILFILTLPLSNPWVRGDGVGYYAFARALLIEHQLDFRKDWLAANSSFRAGRVDAQGQILASEYTPNGHLDNHFAIGPAILWFPFLLVAQLSVQANHALGGNIPADGFSLPYAMAMCIGTACYGFLALWLSFRLGRKYLGEKWVFLSVIGIWFASSFLVYVYFNPSWSHTHSAFVVALFLWYWDRTRGDRTWAQWLILGAIAGLMMNVYYVNGILLLVPLIESCIVYARAFASRRTDLAVRLFFLNLLFLVTTVAAFLPTLISKKILYGSFLNMGYTEHWFLGSPALLKVCFSAEHGLFSWTPIILLAVVGLFFLRRRDALLGYACIAVFFVYLYAIGCYEDWAGISSFGSRFFVSLTPVFILGLGALFEWLGTMWQERRAAVLAVSATAVLILWNAGLVFQWGVHLIPARGPISWRDAAYNQVAVVPAEATRTIMSYLTRRKQLMRNIEQTDIEQSKPQQPANAEPRR